MTDNANVEPEQPQDEPQQPETDVADEADDEQDETFLEGVSEDNAVLLLAAAEEQGLDPSVVQVDSVRGGFSAPAEVVAAAKSDTKKE